MWQERRWLDLLTLIDWLPRNSAYMEAISEDEEVAEQVLQRPADRKPRGAAPRISEWSPEVERLTDVIDRLGEVMVAIIASQGSKAPKLRPQPRPRTAIDRLREKRRYEHHKKVVSRVIIQPGESSAATQPVRNEAKRLPKVAIAKPGAEPSRPAIAPGEDPFRLKSPRSRPKDPPGGAITGEPKKPAT